MQSAKLRQKYEQEACMQERAMVHHVHLRCTPRVFGVRKMKLVI